MAEILDIVRDSRLETILSDGLVQHTCRHAGTGTSHVPDEVWKRERLLSRRQGALVWVEECIQGVRQGEHRAVKSIVKRIGSRSINFNNEVQALSLFSQPQCLDYFVGFYGWFEDHETLYIAMELFRLGDLSRYMCRPFSNEEACHLLSQVVRGMAFMHDRNFSHRDLKPQNILVKQSRPRWSVRIADFGISKRITDTTVLRTEIGTRHYMAPEVMGIFTLEDLRQDPPKDGRYSLVVDVWSLGVLAFHLLTNSLPFPDVRSLSSFVTLGMTAPTDSLSSFNVSFSCADFIKSCLVPSPLSRPTVPELEAHPWLRSASEAEYDSALVAQPASMPTNSQAEFYGFDITEPSGNWETVRPTVEVAEPPQPPQFSPRLLSTINKSSNETQTLKTTIGDEEFDFDDVIVNSAAYRKAFAKQMKRIGNDDTVSPLSTVQKRTLTNVLARLLPHRRRPIKNTDNEPLSPSRIVQSREDSRADEDNTSRDYTLRDDPLSRIARMSALDPDVRGLGQISPTENDAAVENKHALLTPVAAVPTHSQDLAASSEWLRCFKDYYSEDHIFPGDKVRVLWPYEPRVSDEFALERGYILRIADIWDDGWATGTMVDYGRAGINSPADKDKSPSLALRGQMKAFPLICVTLPQHWGKEIRQDISRLMGK